MATHLDHIEIRARNIFESADRLRAETGLGYYDGGWNPGGNASRIFPLGGTSYIQMSGLVDAFVALDPAKANARKLLESVRDADRFTGFNLRADSPEEMQQIAAAHGTKVTDNPATGRHLPSGFVQHVSGVPGDSRKGMPGWNYFFDMNMHPSGQLVEPAPDLVRPMGVAWLEVGGSEEAMTQWLGFPSSRLSLRFNGKDPGLYAIGVRTDKGEVTIRRKSAAEV
jgi:hypothetical protein